MLCGSQILLACNQQYLCSRSPHYCLYSSVSSQNGSNGKDKISNEETSKELENEPSMSATAMIKEAVSKGQFNCHNNPIIFL